MPAYRSTVPIFMAGLDGLKYFSGRVILASAGRKCITRNKLCTPRMGVKLCLNIHNCHTDAGSYFSRGFQFCVRWPAKMEDFQSGLPENYLPTRLDWAGSELACWIVSFPATKAALNVENEKFIRWNIARVALHDGYRKDNSHWPKLKSL